MPLVVNNHFESLSNTLGHIGEYQKACVKKGETTFSPFAPPGSPGGPWQGEKSLFRYLQMLFGFCQGKWMLHQKKSCQVMHFWEQNNNRCLIEALHCQTETICRTSARTLGYMALFFPPEILRNTLTGRPGFPNPGGPGVPGFPGSPANPSGPTKPGLPWKKKLNTAPLQWNWTECMWRTDCGRNAQT